MTKASDIVLNEVRYHLDTYDNDTPECCGRRPKIFKPDDHLGIFDVVAVCSQCGHYQYKLNGKWQEKK